MFKKKSNVSKEYFACEGLVGKGGFGKVYSAKLKCYSSYSFAVKVINKYQLLEHKTGATILKNELEALKKINSEFIIRLHFAFHDMCSCYLVFDLKSGGDLRQHLKNKVRFEELDVAFYVACLADALHFIHSKKVIHRDVKPENIVLDEIGYPHLTDFGVAYVHEDPNEASELKCQLASGTRQYLAPEVFTKSRSHGPEVDFWALGVVAYELLFQKRPFDKHCPATFVQYLDGHNVDGVNNSTVDAYNCSMGLNLDSNTTQIRSNNNSPVRSARGESLDSARNSTKESNTPSRLPAFTSFSWSSNDAAGRKSLFQCPGSPKCNSPRSVNVYDSIVPQGSPSNGRLSPHSSGKASPSLSPKKSKSPARIEEEVDEESVNKSSDGSPSANPTPHPSQSEYRPRLPPHLRVAIPCESIWLGRISPSCQDMLQGLMEVRPGVRYGVHDRNTFRDHSWLEENFVSDLELLKLRKIVPRFAPSQWVADNELRRRGRGYDDQSFLINDDNGPLISPIQEAGFHYFEYVSETFKDAIPRITDKIMKLKFGSEEEQIHVELDSSPRTDATSEKVDSPRQVAFLRPSSSSGARSNPLLNAISQNRPSTNFSIKRNASDLPAPAMKPRSTLTASYRFKHPSPLQAMLG